ncbi:MAG TPA: DJ-1/PfpI family protein [Polyangiaceae bacterium]|nr:DJ-1/PfpI family protein [Polyangiaceae bacterium]
MQTRARRAAVVLFEEVELLDVAAPLQVLSVAGRRWNFRPFKLELLARNAGLVSTRNQARLEARPLSEAAPADIVIVPGGYGARRLATEEEDLRELRRICEGAELIAAIGNGVLALARAGLCSGERVAASAEICQELGTIDAVVADPRAKVVEGNRVLSASSSGSALTLGLAIVRRTMGPKLVSMVAAELGLELDEHQILEIRY